MSAIVDELRRAEQALSFIPADIDRDRWWKVGAALKHEFGEPGFDVFDGWSRAATSYAEVDVRDTWKSLRFDGGITIATLYALAKEYGFDPRQHKAAVIDPAELERRRTDREARTAREEERTQKAAKQAATRAVAIWNNAPSASADHPYLDRKKVSGAELRVFRGRLTIANVSCDGALIVPGHDEAGQLLTLQFITSNGDKRFLPGAQKRGSFGWIGGAVNDTLLIGEGYATCATLAAVTGFPVAVAFDSDNLLSVSKSLRQRHPAARIIMCADDDHKTKGNPGLSSARAAAAEISGELAQPEFHADRPDDATDFNDMCQLYGPGAVKRSMEKALAARFPAADDRPCYRVYDTWQRVGDRQLKPGVWYHSVKFGKGDAEPELTDEWISTPLYVLAVTRNPQDGDYGRLLSYISPAGKWKKWSMPMAMLAADGGEARGVLLSEGVMFNLKKRSGVLDYIVSQYPKLTMRAATATGWCGEAFVLPDEVIGADDIWFQAMGRTAPYGMAGEFDGWKRGVSAVARGNPLLMLSICAGLAGPLLSPLNVEGAGLHFYSDSSTGKSTSIYASLSAWGSPAYKRTWRATGNGLETAGSLHTDTLLALDEIGEIKPQDLYDTVYALINGTGKTRATRHIESRPVAHWRVFVVSSGEMTIAARMAEGGLDARAGHDLRILGVPASDRYGMFADLHNFADGGALSDAIKLAASEHYGHAGPAFVRNLAADRKADGGKRLRDLYGATTGRFPSLNGQEGRAARIFAICALAGELSIGWDIVPWSEGEPTKAALHAFGLWQARRGGNGQSAEHNAILRAVSDFIDRHGDSRFSDISAAFSTISNRAGYWQQEFQRRLYLFTAGGLREAVKGYDFDRVLKALEVSGALSVTGNGKRSKTTRTPDGRTPRLYHVDAEKLCEA